MNNMEELMTEGLEKLNQALTGSTKAKRTTDKTFSAYFNKENTAYEAMFRLDYDGVMDYNYREVKEEPEFTMVSFGMHAIDETKKPVDVFDDKAMLHAAGCLEEMAIEDYWYWREETGDSFYMCAYENSGGNS